MSPIMGMICRPTITMRNFVPAVSIDRRLTVVRYDNVAGVVTLPGASYREEIKTHRDANRAHFSLRHNAFDDLTIIRMIVLRGRFETGRGRAGLAGTGIGIGITHDVKNRKMSRNGAATELFQLINRDPQQKKATKVFFTMRCLMICKDEN
jgi:hypothetical protein